MLPLGMEIWKEITGYVGLYQVSNLGSVRSLDRFVKGRGSGLQLRKGIVLKGGIQNKGGKGYRYVGLWKENKLRQKLIHRLVAESFIDRISDKNFVNHKDFNKMNNTVDNLEWMTAQENVDHYMTGVRSGEIKRPDRRDSNTRRFVSWSPKDKMWVAFIWNTHTKKQVYGGGSVDKEVAYLKAYDKYVEIYNKEPWEELDL